MANTYAWVVSSLETAPSEDGLEKVVKTIHWRRSVTDDSGNTTDIYGALSIPSPDAGNFTAYADLTQSTIEGWLDANLDVDNLNTRLDSKLEAIVNPSRVTYDLPWVEQEA